MSTFTRTATPAFSANPLQTFVTYKQARRAAKAGGALSSSTAPCRWCGIFQLMTMSTLGMPPAIRQVNLVVIGVLTVLMFILGWRIWVRPGPWKAVILLLLALLNLAGAIRQFSVVSLVIMGVTLNFCVIALSRSPRHQRPPGAGSGTVGPRRLLTGRGRGRGCARQFLRTPDAHGWEAYLHEVAQRLLDQTGQDLKAWNARVSGEGPADEASLKAWLAGQGVTGYPASLLAREQFGYPDWFTASSQELIDGQYADRAALRPVFEAIVEAAEGVGEVVVQARKTDCLAAHAQADLRAIEATIENAGRPGLRARSGTGRRPAAAVQDSRHHSRPAQLRAGRGGG